MATAVVTSFAASLAGRRVLVTGIRVSGRPAARVLAAHGAVVTAVDSGDDAEHQAMAEQVAGPGISVRLGARGVRELPAGTSLVVTSPGWQPDAPLLVEAAAAGIEVIGDVELAWRLRPVASDGGRQRWLAVTGTNGKTTTVRMLAAMLTAAGYRAVAAGNVGTSMVEVVTRAEPDDVVAAELSSFQLHWSSTIVPQAAVVLNVAAHHLDWHGDLASYTAAKARIYAAGTIAVCNADDACSVALAAAAAKAGRVVPFRLGEPAPGELGVVGDLLVDRAFAGQDGAGVALAAVRDVAGADRDRRAPAPHNVANALAAAALARAYGAPPEAIAAGLLAFQPEPHRIALVGNVGGVDFVDDSKASNCHAAAASLAAFGSVVWVAGGLFKGADADLDRLVQDAAPRLRGVVLLGIDRGRIVAPLVRHAPDVPVVEVTGTDTGVMDLVVKQAAALAQPGDTVLLAPAAQSFDIFRNYPARGDAFAAAVRRLAATR
jgi:UDP-N-acetylmuramoylalanine--D-glutamate ligase